jgi:orsellinic acid C2-O-methyltransferase
VHRAPAERAYELVNGFRASQLVRLAAQLRIPDLLADGPLSAEDLGVATGIDADRLHRVLRGLAGLGVIVETEEGRFRNSEVGNLFREGVHGSQRARALMLLPESYRAWDHLMETVRSGKTGHEIAHGGSLWDSLARDADFAKRFNQAMVSGTAEIAEFVAAGSDFSSASVIVDVGGGNGALAAGILRAHPHLRAIICDLPAGLAGTREYLTRQGVLDRCAAVEADFFETVPIGGDVYLLKDIIHDWDDEHATVILSACRRAAGQGARILLIERLLPTRVTDNPEHLNAVMTDLQMMVQLGSRERTLAGYRALLDGAGFQFERSLDGTLYGIVEGVAS